METNNVDVALRYFAAETGLAARKDDTELETLVADMTATLQPDVVMDLGPLSLSRRGVYHGPEQVVEFARDEMNEAWSGYEIEVETAVTNGPFVALVYSETLVARRSGIPARRRAADVYEIRRGKIAAIRYFREPEDALRALWLPYES